jgi:hypothetical protein
LVTLAETKTEFNNWISEDATVSFLEKAQAGKTTLEDIADALDEYKRLHDAGLASPAEVITLARAYPTNKKFTDEADGLDEDEDVKPMVVGGPASVELVDREGQVGHALPAYISKSGAIFKSGVDDNGLFFISELRGDTRISKRVRDQIIKGGMSSYSIAGSATKSKDIKKSDGSNVLQVDDMELAEVTICEKGVNQGAHFELLKGDKAEGSCADGSCLHTSAAPTPTTVITIAKEDIPSYTEMFNDWISKAPMVGGAAGKTPKSVTPPASANVTGGIGMPVKMSMEKRKEKINPYAIATAMAKKKGFKNFAEDSKGDKYRDKITEGIKESEGIKKALPLKALAALSSIASAGAEGGSTPRVPLKGEEEMEMDLEFSKDSVQHLVKDAFHEMVAGIQKQPIDYGGFQPGGTTKKKDTSKPKTTEDKAKDIASQVSMQSAGEGTGVRTKEGSRKKSIIDQQAASAGATTEGARASTAAGRSIQRQEKLRQNLQDPDFRAQTKRTADARGVSYDSQVKEMKQTAKDPAKMRNIYDQVGSAQGGKLDRAQSMAPIMDRTGGQSGMNKPKKGGGPPRMPKFSDPNRPKVKDIDRQVQNITSNMPKPSTPKGGADKSPKLSGYERATGNVKGQDKFFGRTKKLASGTAQPGPKPAGDSGGKGKSTLGKIGSFLGAGARKIASGGK